MKLVIGLIIVIGVLIGLKSIAQSKGLTITELIQSWFPTMPTGLEKAEEPLTTGAPLNPTLTEALFRQIPLSSRITEPWIAQVQW